MAQTQQAPPLRCAKPFESPKRPALDAIPDSVSNKEAVAAEWNTTSVYLFLQEPFFPVLVVLLGVLGVAILAKLFANPTLKVPILTKLLEVIIPASLDLLS